MEDVPPALRHLVAEQADALAVDNLDVRHELLRLVADRPERQLDRAGPCHVGLDLCKLTTLHESGQSDVDHHVVGNVRSSRDDSLQAL